MAGNKTKKLTSKKLKVPTAPAKRGAVLFARIQKTNKEWLDKQAKSCGYKDTATFLDAFISEAKTNIP